MYTLISCPLFVVSVEAVADDGYPCQLLPAPVGPQQVVVHGLAAVWHEEEGVLVCSVLAVLEEKGRVRSGPYCEVH